MQAGGASLIHRTLGFYFLIFYADLLSNSTKVPSKNVSKGLTKPKNGKKHLLHNLRTITIFTFSIPGGGNAGSAVNFTCGSHKRYRRQQAARFTASLPLAGQSCT